MNHKDLDAAVGGNSDGRPQVAPLQTAEPGI
jgi:hypothetical protein